MIQLVANSRRYPRVEMVAINDEMTGQKGRVRVFLSLYLTSPLFSSSRLEPTFRRDANSSLFHLVVNSHTRPPARSLRRDDGVYSPTITAD
jgi:hypothetical protein